MCGCWIYGCWVLGVWVMGIWILDIWVLDIWVLGVWALNESIRLISLIHVDLFDYSIKKDQDLNTNTGPHKGGINAIAVIRKKTKTREFTNQTPLHF